MNSIEAFVNGLTSLALTVPRIAAAFLVLPLMTKQTVPALVRNSYVVSLAFVVAPIAVATRPMAMNKELWPMIVVKEAFIGLCIGFLFGLIFWGIEMVGNVIDTKVGSNSASILDPLTGHDTSLTADFLQQFAAWLFLASGGMMIFLTLLLGSYGVWPLDAQFPQFTKAGASFFIEQFDEFMILVILLAAPALVILALVDLSLGLVNRYAQQLNVLTLSMALKGWLSVLVVMLLLSVFVQFVLTELAKDQSLLDVLKRVLPPG